MSRKQANNLVRSNQETLDFVHSDVCGPMGISSVRKEKYFVTMYGETYAVSILRFIKTKDQTSWDMKSIILELKYVAENRGNVRHIRMYFREEFLRNTFLELFTSY